MWDRVQQSNQVEVVSRLVQARPLTAMAVTLVVGLLLGWMVLGWLVVPVRWENAGPVHLSDNYQNEWVQMAADSFALTLDVSVARERIGSLQVQAASAVERALQISRDAEQLRIAQLQYGIGDTVYSADGGTSKELEPALSDGEVSSGAGLQNTRALLSALGGVLLLVVLSVAGLQLRRRFGVMVSREEVSESGGDSFGTPVTASSSPADESATDTSDLPPVARFMTTYMLGDNLYDDSFSIDDANGDFLGECGVGVSETVGVGDAKKVTALEVWLFDKNDVRTVTKVLMSEHAFGDEVLRTRLAPKGAPVLASPGETMVLDTASLHVTARVVDMEYGSGALPENSFFHQLTIELAAWKKGQASVVQA